MKKLDGRQNRIAFLTLFLLAAPPCAKFLQDALPAGNGVWSFIAIPMAHGLLAALISRFLYYFSEKPQKDQPPLPPFGWMTLAYFYVLFVLINYLWFAKADHTLGHLLIIPLIFIVIFAVLDRLVFNCSTFRYEMKQS